MAAQAMMTNKVCFPEESCDTQLFTSLKNSGGIYLSNIIFFVTNFDFFIKDQSVSYLFTYKCQKLLGMRFKVPCAESPVVFTQLWP